MTQNSPISKIIVEFGILRILLLLLAIVLMVLRPWASAEVTYYDWNMIPTLVAPALVPIVFMGIWLDVIMCFVFRSDKTGPVRKKYNYAVIADVVTNVALLVFWLSYFTSLGEPAT